MDAAAALRSLPDASVQCFVTSPPYWGLRDYSERGQIGLESTPEEYVERLVSVFREARRVLRPDGVLWLNLGDSYAGARRGRTTGRTSLQGGIEHQEACKDAWKRHPSRRRDRAPSPRSDFIVSGLKAKDMVGAPWRVAFALQADGWYLRADVIWAKPNPMPESVLDRPTKSHEYLFLLSKSEHYYYDSQAIAEPIVYGDHPRNGCPGPDIQSPGQPKQSGLTRCRRSGNKERVYGPGRCRPDSHLGAGVPWEDRDGTRNARSVWTICTQPYPGAHFATFPEALAERCILAGTSEKGCCPSCGAPWLRAIKKRRSFASGSGRSGNRPTGKHPDGLQGGGETGDIRRGPVITAHTVGWKAGCSCGARAPGPCLVCDPFAGAGTAGVVAVRLGRRFIGYDLAGGDKDLGGHTANERKANPFLSATDLSRGQRSLQAAAATLEPEDANP
jgi:DNA modification methylase